MANRIVPVSVSGPWIQFGGDASGAVGSANALTLRVHFDSQWDGTGKTAYFWDALRLEATKVLVALGSLVPGETDTYDVPVPGECMTQGGYVEFNPCSGFTSYSWINDQQFTGTLSEDNAKAYFSVY